MLKSETEKRAAKKTTAPRKKTGTTAQAKKGAATPAPTASREAISERPTYEEISRRAYELYVAGGRRDGRASDDWRRAEQDLRNERKQATALQEHAGKSKGNA